MLLLTQYSHFILLVEQLKTNNFSTVCVIPCVYSCVRTCTYIYVRVRTDASVRMCTYTYLRMCTYESVRTMIFVMLNRTREMIVCVLYFEKNFLQEQLRDIEVI